MAQEHVYKILFFVQSAAFILLIINYSQTSSVVNAPVRSPSPKVTACRCEAKDLSAAQLIPSAPVCPGPAAEPDETVAATRGRLSNCSLADIQRRPNVVLLTTTNFGFLDITMNMLASIRQIGLCVNTTIVAEDQRAHDFLRAQSRDDPGVNVRLTASGEVGSREIPRTNRRDYYAMFNKRAAYILDYLERGVEVLFSDGDTFWFRDPFPFFRGEFDISLIDSRSPYPQRTPQGDFCAGFVYYKPTAVTVQFVKAWIQTMRDNDKIGRLLADQSVMNGLLKNDKPVYVNIKPLDTNIFPWGPKFYELLAKKAGYPTVVMHAASIRGRAAKIAKFKTSNMWLVNKTVEEMVNQV